MQVWMILNKLSTNLLACVVLAVTTTQLGSAQSPDQPAKPQKSDQNYVRLLYSESDEPIALQTSIRSFVDEQNELVVDLVGAIHVGEATYFSKLNELFRDYDAVLYELVAPEGTRIPKGGAEPSSAVSYLQDGMTTALGLEFQLNRIDYTKKNLVHADMSPEEFAASMKAREESLAKTFFRALGQSIVRQNTKSSNTTDLQVFSALFSENRELELRRALASQFADLDGSMLVFEGPDGSTLVTERNKKALSVLKRELKNGHNKVAIFFGAGHMKDMAQRLERDFDLQPTKLTWLTAWDLREVHKEEDASN